MESSEYQLNKFIEYIRTKQFMLNALRGIDPNTFVYVSMSEIKSRFLVNPSNDIKSLVEAGEIAIQESVNAKGHKYYSYKVLKAGYYDLNLLEPKGRDLNRTTERMMHILKDVSLKKDSPSTDYFNSFLEHKNHLLRIFFNVDCFSGRVHTPITNFHRTHRPNILIDGIETVSLDVVTMQPVLLGAILKKSIGENEFSSWINEGKDIYLMLQSKAKLKSRDEAKKRFFEILFSRPNDSLENMFGNSNWITWINQIKKRPFTENPHSLEKNHSNLAYILQTSEVNVMTEVWSDLLNNGIKFLSVHDEIIIKHSDHDKARGIFNSVLSKYLPYFRLSGKQPLESKQANNNLNNLKTYEDEQYREFERAIERTRQGIAEHEKQEQRTRQRISELTEQCKGLESTFIQASKRCNVKWYAPQYITEPHRSNRLRELMYWTS